jgi:hypothetical protein
MARHPNRDHDEFSCNAAMKGGTDVCGTAEAKAAEFSDSEPVSPYRRLIAAPGLAGATGKARRPS